MSASPRALHFGQPRLKACFDYFSALFSVASCEFRVRGHLGFHFRESEQPFDLADNLLFPLYLKKQAEREIIDDQFSARDAPRHAALFVNERRPVAKRVQNRCQRIGIPDARFILALVLDGRLGGEAFFVGENGLISGATQAQDTGSRIKTIPPNRILFKPSPPGRPAPRRR